MYLIAAITAACIAVVIIYRWCSHTRPAWHYLASRSPDEPLWRQRYSPEQMTLVNRALQSLVEAFLLRTEDLYRIRPDDRLLAIYRAAYPGRATADALEFSTLAECLIQHFNVPGPVLAQATDPSVEDVVHWCLQYGHG